MQAAAAPSPEDKLAFAKQLAQVRAMDVKGKYKKQLNKIEVEYQFIRLRSLDLFHKEKRRASLPERLHLIKEKLDVYISHQPSFHQLELEHDMPPLSQD